jgi:hypothetical protein
MALYEINDNVKSVISKLCDIALKAGGMANKPGVDLVIGALSKSFVNPQNKGETNSFDKSPKIIPPKAK